jgi:hypothetical protein
VIDFPYPPYTIYPWPQTPAPVGWRITQVDSGATYLLGPNGETYRLGGDGKWHRMEGWPA